MQNGLGAVLRLDDDHVGLGEALFDVAALEAPRLAVELPAAHRLLRVDERLEDLPLDVDQVERGACLPFRVGRNGRD